ncbi:MAG: hypothetical protein ACYC35_04180 [Pirellulales bacterium]
MCATDAKSRPALGFLTVVKHEQHGLFGGYLVLNLAGRPLEFHCTAPVKPNRAQEILYGPTLESYLYGEQIGQTLLSKVTVEPMVVCTDLEPMLAVREFVQVPVALVTPGEEADRTIRIDGPHRAGPSLALFQLGRNRLAVAASRDADRLAIAERLEAIADGFDLAEPFTRIREAIEEAQRGGR